jgi:hypothetical protein
MELCREVGKSFEAVAQKNLGVSLPDDEMKVGKVFPVSGLSAHQVGFLVI